MSLRSRTLLPLKQTTIILFQPVAPLYLDRSLDQLKPPAAEWVDGDAHTGSKATVPVDEIPLLSSKALHGHQQLTADRYG